jgi:membrane protein YdbS with pleckstrin-like domain
VRRFGVVVFIVLVPGVVFTLGEWLWQGKNLSASFADGAFIVLLWAIFDVIVLTVRRFARRFAKPS